MKTIGDPGLWLRKRFSIKSNESFHDYDMSNYTTHDLVEILKDYEVYIKS